MPRRRDLTAWAAQWRRHWPALALVLLVTVFELGGSPWREALRFDRSAILDGEAWRLLSGHFVHLGWPHYAMNMAALVLIWLLFRRQWTSAEFALVVGAGALAISVGLLCWQLQLDYYVGFSGVLHGLFMFGAVRALRKPPRLEAALLLGALLFKLGWERWNGALPGSAQWAGGAVIVEAHLYGAIAGLVLALLLLMRRPQTASP
jgi:rhomboid family GlyGly-CTERM serine protease